MNDRIKRTNDEAVSFLKCKMQSKDNTKIKSKKIIDNFLLNTENISKFPKIKTVYKNETI